MAISKQKYVALFFFLWVQGCHLVTQDEIAGTGLPPDPIIVPTRNIVLLPIDMPKKGKKSEYVWLATQAQEITFNYLQFIESTPATINNTQIKNAKDLWAFYNISKPNKAKQIELLNKVFDTNKTHWLTITPEDQEEIIKRYTLPASLDLNITQGNRPPVEYLDNGYIIAQLKLQEDYSLSFSVYDSILGENIQEWNIKFPKAITKVDTEENPKVLEMIKEKMKKTLEDIEHKKAVEVFIPPISKDLSVYFGGKLVLMNSLFTTQGKHEVYVSQLGSIIQRGFVDIQQTGEINIEEALAKQQGQELVITTTPAHIPLFIDEKYVGLTPLSLQIPEGIHYLRASSLNYGHLNYILDIDPLKPMKELTLDLPLQDQVYLDRIGKLREVKLGTFYTGLTMFAGLIYARERGVFYGDKINHGVDLSLSNKRYNQFLIAQYSFGGLGLALLTTALVAQILEYQARDIGIGIGQDGNLGVTYRF